MTRDHADVVGVAGASAQLSGPDGGPASPEADELQEVRQFMLRSWSELLGSAGLTEHADFFARGGDSLLMTRLVRRVGEEYGVTVSLQDMSRRNLGDQALLVHRLRTRMLARMPRPGAGAHQVWSYLKGEWAELLGHPPLSGASDFFALGGDSLLVARLVRRVEKEFGVKVAVHDMLAAPTLGEQVLLVRAHVDAAARAALRPRGRAA
ncbi:acyl carrier protein [Streptomyces sp. Da 82-17]|uniref:acyl carrier protein n=1 Tax=Streptomyces sp. Da 82-17 TaxID=3377116 RepID=UPI0038D3C159